MEVNLTPPIETKTIPIWLRDTYARVSPDGLFSLEGFKEVTPEIETLAENSILAGFSVSNFFLRGDSVFAYLNRTLNSAICNQTITLIVPGLRDLYWNNRSRLAKDEILSLELAMKKPLPSFTNIFDYKSLQPLRNGVLVSIYQLYGNITPYDVVQIPVQHFLKSINEKIPISVALEGINIIFQFSYAEYDFWDPEANQVIDIIDFNRCNI